MKCTNCGKDFPIGASQCPHCHTPVNYNGLTSFVNDVSIKDFFVNIFGSQPPGAGEKMFVSGTALTTPTPDKMLKEWNKPWLYARVILIGVLFWALCYFMFTQQNHPAGLYMLFSFGCLVFPLAVLIFYWEINIPRDIPIYRVIMIFFVGGMLSLIFTILLPQSEGPAYLAPLTEEPGKVLVIVLFIYWLEPKYIFGGLLIGAAVGAGFAAFEDIWYVLGKTIRLTVAEIMKYMSANPNASPESLIHIFENFHQYVYKIGIDTLIARSVGTLAGHVTFAAIEGGALVMAKGKDNLGAKHFFDVRFLAYFGSAMAMHAAWNYSGENESFRLHPLPYIGDVTFLIITVAAIFIAFSLIQRAVAQVLQEVNSAAPIQEDFSNTPMLLAGSGPLINSLFPIKQTLTLGRDPALCNVVFPSGTPGISRRHCVIEKHSDGIYLMDLNSLSGTFLQNGQKLAANQWVKVTDGFYLGSQNAMFTIDYGSKKIPPTPNPNPPAPPTPNSNNVSIVGIAGPLQGSTFSDPQRLTIGRDPSTCNVVLPSGTPGVSRRHCILERTANGVFIADVGSTAGTFLSNGQKIPQNQWVQISGEFYLGSVDVKFKIN
ncbi:MAG: FHA domain-containing protein [Selenomonadaceae bacterium]|nr:FHA domain-containing protein [Selenomonadaceae bacterium]